MPFHQDSLCPLSHRPAPERPLEALELGEPLQRDVERASSSSASPSTRYAKTPRLAASRTKSASSTSSSAITGQAASCTILEIRAKARSELSPTATSATSGFVLAVVAAHVGDVELTRDDGVPEPLHDRRRGLEAVLSLVGDEDAEGF